ncbi:hypothetical protein GUJ93_ZPchr0003g18290 [Zizania palustris]|uniref:Uncharacterized protein n=1 Tax=Zizania palustris TaxID=103762 RepID=A0A8J5S995_ZIZPA|nr:hypothetical protein GUJ93_ZPchr0003g18290 [Zizania palustris]
MIRFRKKRFEISVLALLNAKPSTARIASVKQKKKLLTSGYRCLRRTFVQDSSERTSAFLYRRKRTQE